jgi:hypothetical protein
VPRLLLFNIERMREGGRGEGEEGITYQLGP